MSIERTYYCDWRECERHASTAARRPPVSFLTVREEGRSLHFCSWDCILRHAAEKEPQEVIPLVED